MTPIEKQALALINEVLASSGYRPIALTEAERWFATTFPAIISAIERHEAFKQEVSEACGLVDMMIGQVFFSEKGNARHVLSRFILPDPVDPLVEAIRAAWPKAAEQFGDKMICETAGALREALAARGLEIVEKKP